MPARATIEKDGWVLDSAEERAAAAPETFIIPSLVNRKALKPGVAVKLLFDIETERERVVHRMWVIVKSRTEVGYVGVLDQDPGEEGSRLREGQVVLFGPEHVADIGQPPRDYILKKYGESFFENRSQ
jgi:uncharacterized protein YegJ (DUF2314 family)